MSNMELTIKSKKLNREFNFSTRGAYIYEGDSQICDGGGRTGSTLMATREQDFKRVCRKWYHQVVRHEHYL